MSAHYYLFTLYLAHVKHYGKFAIELTLFCHIVLHLVPINIRVNLPIIKLKVK